MGVTVNLVNDADTIDTSKDNVVIVDVFASIRGGRSLDTTGFTPTVIKAGHVIIVETATGIHKPMPLNAGGTAYAALPADHAYAGILIALVVAPRLCKRSTLLTKPLSLGNMVLNR